MPWKLFEILIVGSLVTLAACGAARVVQRDQIGGTIELQGDRGKAMEQASEQMAAHCGPNNFTIVDEGEEATGATRTATAWRVHYQCGIGAAVGSGSN